MFINMISVWMMKMAVVQVIDMSFMANRGMTTVRTMLMVMMLVMLLFTITHLLTPYPEMWRKLRLPDPCPATP
jgi:hypothetical protein